jgi:hypothetical protein
MFNFLKKIFGKTTNEAPEQTTAEQIILSDLESVIEQSVPTSPTPEPVALAKSDAAEQLEPSTGHLDLVNVTKQAELVQPMQLEPELKPETPSKAYIKPVPEPLLELKLEPVPTTERQAQQSAAEPKPTAQPEFQPVPKADSEIDLQALLSENRLCLIPALPFIVNTKRLFQILFYPLTGAEQTRLIGLLFDQIDEGVELHNALLSLCKEGGQAWGQWILVNARTDNIDDFEWQAQELAYNWQLADDFEWACEEEVTRAAAPIILQGALKDYAKWLDRQGFNLFTLESSQSTGFMAVFILPHLKLNEFKPLAKQVGLQYNPLIF